MADYYVREEDGTSKYILEDASGDYLLETNVTDVESGFIASVTTVYAAQVFLTNSLTLATAGTYTWACPPGVTTVEAQCYGGGGGGASGGFAATPGGGGGGGAYAARLSVPVTPGATYTIVVGVAGAVNGGTGGDTTFTGDSGVQVVAKGATGASGGTGGTAGQASGSTGDTGLKFSGGDGGAGTPGAGDGGGGGGASGNPVATGAAGGTSGAGAGFSGAGGVGSNGGGSGGNGGVYPSGPAVQPGASPGGGGGGGHGDPGGGAESGAAGAAGRVQVTTLTTFTVPFIASVTVVYPPTLVGAPTEVDLPFIPSHTVVYGIWNLFDPNLTFSGPGNGGETFGLRLNAGGVTTTATLATAIGVGGTPSLTMTGDSGMPDVPFVVTIDSEQILLAPQGGGAYLIRQRPMGNTTIASHSAGATVSWNDSYDMTIISHTNINTDFTADIESTGSSLYTGFLMAFDSSQAYKTDGTRFPLHVTEFMGVFVAGAGVGGTNKVDGSQPSAIHTPEIASDHCGAALTVPALMTLDIVPGDVIVVRYTNPAAFVLDLGPRSGAIQSWFGLKRVDTTDHDVTYTNPNGICVDTKSGYATYTGSVNTEPDEPLPSVTGIAMDSSDAAGHAIPTPGLVPWLTVTLPGTDRYFTDSIHYNERGWPIGMLSVRQGNRRVPLWQSWDWHNFSYVYSGFGTDDSFAQVVINRNGMTGVLPTISLPGPQDIDGPNAYWDDGTYYFGASWYVVLVATPYLVFGPVIGGTGPPAGVPVPGIPGVGFPGGGGGSPVVTPPSPIEGGSGGDITPSSTGLHVWQLFG